MAGFGTHDEIHQKFGDDELYRKSVARELLRLSQVAHVKHRWLHISITAAIYELTALFFLAVVRMTISP